MEKAIQQKANINIKWIVTRTVINLIIIILDTIPGIAIPASFFEDLNTVLVLANRVGFRVPSLTPNISNAVLGAGIISEVFDAATLELLPFPSSIFIQGAQILYDVRHIHKYVLEHPKYSKYERFTGFLNAVSMKLMKTS